MCAAITTLEWFFVFAALAFVAIAFTCAGKDQCLPLIGRGFVLDSTR